MSQLLNKEKVNKKKHVRKFDVKSLRHKNYRRQLSDLTYLLDGFSEYDYNTNGDNGNSNYNDNNSIIIIIVMMMIVTMAILKIKARIFIMVIYIFVVVKNSLV